jgi:hypothetical protein
MYHPAARLSEKDERRTRHARRKGWKLAHV